MTTIYDRSGKNTVGIADGPVCGSGDDDPRQGIAKPVASMTDDAAMLIKQPGDVDWDTLGRERALFNQQGAVLEKLDPLEMIVGRLPPARASVVLRDQVALMLKQLTVYTIEQMETSTGSPQLSVRMHDGAAVNITFTVARR